MITLRPVDRNNWFACSRIAVCDHQHGLVASNLETIAESKFEPHFHLRAIYHHELVVGMLVYCHENDPEDLELYWIFRLIIDGSSQGKGFGSEAMKLAIGEIRTLGATRIRTMHKPGNLVASSLYEKLGFELTGEMLDDGDILRELILNQPIPEGEVGNEQRQNESLQSTASPSPAL
jgi:diamine N-acetyltransferase